MRRLTFNGERTLALTCSECDWIELTEPLNRKMSVAEARKGFDEHICRDFQKYKAVYDQLQRNLHFLPVIRLRGGGRGIRTPGTVSRTSVFKTDCFNRSHIPPRLSRVYQDLPPVDRLQIALWRASE
jgi:hypothetical protein